MAALSLTEIRDAFADEPAADAQYNTPIQELPDHRKKSDPVNVRLVADSTPNRISSGAARRSRRSTRSTHQAPPHAAPSEDKAHLTRIANNALTLTIGLAIHSAIISAINYQFESSNLTVFNQLCIRFTYPVAVMLLVWAIKRWSS